MSPRAILLLKAPFCPSPFRVYFIHAIHMVDYTRGSASGKTSAYVDQKDHTLAILMAM
jgi:hypothetical protein